MKTIFYLNLLIASALLSNCVFPLDIVCGSDDTTVVSKAVSGFSNVSVSNSCDAVITSAETYSVAVEINDNLEKYLNIELVNGSLNIFLDKDHTYSHLTFKVTIAMPELEKLSCCDASKMTVSGFNSEKTFNAVVSDASKLNGTINCGNISIHVSDASEATLSGSASDLVCSVTDASKLRFKGMRCSNVAVDITDASDADVYVSGRLTGKVTDASKLVYYGNAVQGTLSVKDASKVVRGD